MATEPVTRPTVGGEWEYPKEWAQYLTDCRAARSGQERGSLGAYDVERAEEAAWDRMLRQIARSDGPAEAVS